MFLMLYAIIEIDDKLRKVISKVTILNLKRAILSSEHISREELNMKNNITMNNDTLNMKEDLDQIRGSLIGGDVGDALGYAIEFWREGQIFETFGPKGITSYKLVKGKAIISDDTQMTLFTGEGLLAGDIARSMSGANEFPRVYVKKSYDDWYLTQTCSFAKVKGEKELAGETISGLLTIPELFAQRAPGLTCLSALRNEKNVVDDYVKNPVNNSKGCGGVMRVAPIALRYRLNKNYTGTLQELDMEAAQLAAITHGHSLGYMPAAVLSHVISRILLDKDKKSLKSIVEEARDTAAEIFAGDAHLDQLIRIINLAIELSENDMDDLDNIHRLGEGWVAEETLGISLYCSLKYSNDFSAAMIASVNHKGDSDSTGAVTGNIVGALVGYDAIEDKWKKNLELHDVILEMADELCMNVINS